MKEPSWETVAKRLYAALADCDWSYGRVQTDRVQGQITEVMDLAIYKQRAVRRRKRKH